MKKNEKKNFPPLPFVPRGRFYKKKINRRMLENILKRSKRKITKKTSLSYLSFLQGLFYRKKNNRGTLKNILKQNEQKITKKDFPILPFIPGVHFISRGCSYKKKIIEEY